MLGERGWCGILSTCYSVTWRLSVPVLIFSANFSQLFIDTLVDRSMLTKKNLQTQIQILTDPHVKLKTPSFCVKSKPP